MQPIQSTLIIHSNSSISSSIGKTELKCNRGDNYTCRQCFPRDRLNARFSIMNDAYIMKDLKKSAYREKKGGKYERDKEEEVK